MNPGKKSKILLLLTLLLLFAAFFFENILPVYRYGDADINRIERIIANTQDDLQGYFEAFELLDDSSLTACNVPVPKDLYETENLGILIYLGDQLTYWSDNKIIVPKKYNDSLFEENFIFLDNTWYVVKQKKDRNRKYIGLITIKHEYPFENEFIRNSFAEKFRVPDQTDVSPVHEPGLYKVTDAENNFLFSIDFSDTQKFGFLRTAVPFLLYFLFLIGLLYLFKSLLGNISNRRKRTFWVFMVIALVFGLKFVMTLFHVPGAFYQSELFDPVYFAASNVFPNLGDVLLFSIIFVYSAYLIFIYVSLPSRFTASRSNSYIFLGILVVLLLTVYSFIQLLFHNLIYNSSITLEFYKGQELNVYSFIVLVIVGLNYIALSLLLLKIFGFFTIHIPKKQLIGFVLLIAVPIGLIFTYTCAYIDIPSLIFFIAFSAAVGLLCYNRYYMPSFSEGIVLVLFVSFFTVYYIHRHSSEKEKLAKRVLATNLATEHDPIAESLIEEFNDSLASDPVLEEMVLDEYIRIENIIDHLRRNYFSGFWTKYDLWVTVCRPEDSVFVDMPDDKWYHCYAFFNVMIQETGEYLPGTNFYFLDNNNGRISYIGNIPFIDTIAGQEASVFLELDSRRLSEELGYPELLLNQKISRNRGLDNYSYAKYYNNKLIAQSGDFEYSLSSFAYGNIVDEYTHKTFEGYDHLLYMTDENNLIIISGPAITVFNLLISLSYITAFFYLLLGFILLIFSRKLLLDQFQYNFKNKIQFAIIAILLVSLLFIGGGAIFFSISQYKEKHYEILSEKIQSVYIELVHKLEDERELTQEWHTPQYDNLNQLLMKFSDVFYSDINLYNPTGELLASSRLEIYEKDLIAKRMNIEAYKELAINKKAEFVHNEQIGSMEYLSAYVPFLNRENNLLAYLNLPYFTKQNVLRAEVSNLLVAVLNIYVLFILLTIAIAVIISDQITRPLRMLQAKFSSIQLGAKTEHIEYKGNDEIGNLVAEYNRMVDELARSVELLAKSERESAWREMAKQIAHEIKNPLTPMKLSVQHLMRTWKDKKDSIEDWDAHLKKFSDTLISQIENLSYIATAFSSFANMPVARFKKVNVVEIFYEVRDLFEKSSDIDFQINTKGNERAFVYADKEHLTRAFINLTKNAIQAIPPGRKGMIKIDMFIGEKNVVIKLMDNGSGIDEEIRDKLFRPNFTTKSSGMGLGLSITKNIIENAHGSIRYETEKGVGTTFIIEIPVVR